jgi:hypothetical protein
MYTVYAVYIGLAIICFLLFEPFRVKSLEGRWFNGLVIVGGGCLWAAILFAWLRFMYLWWLLRKLLGGLERLSLRKAFSRIPVSSTLFPVWKRGGIERLYLVDTRSWEYLQCLARIALRQDSNTNSLLSRFCEYLRWLAHSSSYPFAKTYPLLTCAVKDERSVKERLCPVLQQERSGNRISAKHINELNTAMDMAAEHCASNLIQLWKQGESDGKDSESLKRRKDLPSIEEIGPTQPTMLMAEFVALRFVAFITYISLQMRNTLTFVSVGFILSLLALKSYPFQPRQTIVWVLITLFVVLGAGIVYVFAQMDKDAVLSRISSTTPGKLDNEFFSRAVSFGALPLLTILATQVPVISDFVFSWVQPTLEKLH